MAATQAAGRQLAPVIASPVTYYVCPAGQTTANYDGDGLNTSVTPSDSNDGLTKATPFATIQKAADTIRGKILLAVVTIQLADTDATHAHMPSNVIFESICLGSPQVSFFDVGAGGLADSYPGSYIYLKGNTATRTNVIMTGAATYNGTAASALRGIVFSGCNARVRGIKAQYYGNTLNAADSGAFQCHRSLLYAEDLDYTSDRKGALLIGWYHSVIKIGGTHNVTNGNWIDVLASSTGEFVTPLNGTSTKTTLNCSMTSSSSNYNAVFSGNSFAKLFLDNLGANFSGTATFTAFNAYEHGNIYSNDAYGANKFTIDFNNCTNATFVEANQGATAFFILGATNSSGTQTGNILRNNVCRAGAFISHQNLFTATNADIITGSGRINYGAFPGTNTLEADFVGQGRQGRKTFTNTGSNSWESAIIAANRGRGTIASPSAVQSGDQLLAVEGVGHNGTGYNGAARFRMEAAETFTGSTGAGRIVFATQRPGGLDNPADAFRIGENGDLAAVSNRGILCNLSGASNVNLTTVTVNTNTTADQNLMSWSVPAGGLNLLLKSLRVFARGLYTTQSAQTPTLTFKIKLGSVTIASWLTTATTASVTNLAWQIESWITTSATGASGTVEAHGQCQIKLGSGAGASTDFLDTNTAVSGAIDLTSSQTLQLTVAFSTNAASANTCAQRQMLVEVVNLS